VSSYAVEEPSRRLSLVRDDGIEWGIFIIGEEFRDMKRRIGGLSSDSPPTTLVDYAMTRAVLKRTAERDDETGRYAAMILTGDQ